MVFRDRAEAGRLLAAAIGKQTALTAGPRLVVGLPRGGVVVGAEVAAVLGLPLEIMVTRKIGAPYQPEAAIGAVTQDGALILDEELVARVRISRDYIEAERARQVAEIERRLAILRGDRPPVAWHGREVVLVDDGIATGFTIRAAVNGLRAEGVAAIWLAVPVASREAAASLRRIVDRFTALLVPEDFIAVGQFYEDFREIEEEEIQILLST
ncbi:MAG: phosphoribosyltransferase [Bacteroidota bacterium]